MSDLLELEDAQARLLALAVPLKVEHVDLSSALGRYLAEPLIARRTQPSADVSAMDGFAMRAGAGPWRLVGESAAGHPFDGEVKPGDAVRISTGALLPTDADAVLIQEDAQCAGDVLTLAGTEPLPGAHIRRQGCDFAEGDSLLEPGVRFGPLQLALAIASGHTHVAVRRIPRVTVIDTGDELAANPEDCAPHQVPASNGAMLSAMLSQQGCKVQLVGPVPDRRDALTSALAAAGDADVIVTSGGASVGKHDVLQPALAALGAEVAFWKVAIKPGKPMLVARLGKQIIVGLPGNPASSFVTAHLFVLPLVRALAGAASPLPFRVNANLAGPCRATGGRREFLAALWDRTTVTTQPPQNSGALRSLASSNALIERPALSPSAAIGEMVTIYPLANGGIA